MYKRQHIAVAIKYDDSLSAPMVVAKGQDHLAEKIKEIARENDVIITENKPLARLLFKRVEVGSYIPVSYTHLDVYKRQA